MPAAPTTNKPRVGLLLLYAVLCFALPALAIGGVVYVAYGVGSSNGKLEIRPEVELPLELIASVLALVGAIAFLVIIFNQMDLTTPSEALGLPDGSIRALLALSLIFLFLIMSVFLYAAVSQAPKDSPSLDIAKQLVTTVATLAVSVAGFYFGTNAVQSAAAAVAGSTPTVKVTSPTGSISIKKGDKAPQTIQLATSPMGLAIDASKIGDPDGDLVATSPTTFVYTPSDHPEKSVVLLFSLASSPQATARVDVTVADVAPAPAPAPPAAAPPPH